MAVLDPRDRHGLPIGLGGDIAPSRSRRRALGPRRAFTLLELVAVLTIITIFAALAIPSAVNQLRDRRVQEAARRIAIVYRQARMHALGRGSAVLVRFEDGNMTVLEARLGSPVAGVDNCADLPVSSCLGTDWGNAAESRVIDGYHAASGDGITLGISTSSGDTDTPVSDVDVCFTPVGRTFSRTNFGVPLAAANEQTFVARLSRPGVGRPRHVALLPNGTARMFSQ
jgi:prepilin-type N-terminal cleavage/methylation domain-containing protein